ncbi:glucose-1-phosphate adenylyltransferase [Paenibacillus mucilaginosus]|uniref:Glucose-1-phosphate adenylyltransferase n=3 Tax=Paenibacillus mucilaginosus TaxID=61624 RepID=H6NAN8_9BACL|nr:glucose-1-phosphate adenylyltransferase [Paenibacillus mucilaginosus]AEI41419.1 GlgC [Paenibacillus mucilaginosus KNP414]AFC29963.1 GlgC [Paenibacillus mucilaginosus 3016]AFH62148.1 glucose-1-phosphate adenylyltransferase [Paenibacillus mucilaginosus K02]MCG7217551.1 glucose-1-phosphate adenylyltransferase [Paenibacillus mucilaginosus]WDM30437.1 glucose-1-phosphate adenylyltransferase [Paenibacillus mucilaginosus]
MRKKECVAMLLAGGEGRRLGVLTSKLAKPAVHFGGKYRIIDFTLSNCTNSGIDTVGVLTQYQPLVLNTYIGIGAPWDLDRKHGGVTVLPPYMEQGGGDWYKGTANAIYRNISFIEQYDPEYVLVISGDHIYKMDYDRMLDYHKQRGADATIAVIGVKWEEASRFGIMATDEEGRITEFAEKPKEPKSNLASMGIYIFSWKALKEQLIKDEEDEESSKDFGKDLIPRMLRENLNLVAYPFEGYWKDVGTIQSLWEANMDLLEKEPAFKLNDREWRIYSVNPLQPGQYIAGTAQVRRSLVNEGCCVFGEVDHSVLFYGVQVGEGSLIKDSVIMPNVTIGSNVKIYKAIIGEGTVVEDGAVIGTPEEEGGGDIVLIGSNERVGKTATTTGKG